MPLVSLSDRPDRLARGPLPLSQKSAFLFDLDGTLVDSEAAHRFAFERALDELAPGLLDEFDYSQVRGRSTREALRQFGILDPDLAARTEVKKQAEYRRLVAEGAVALFPKAKELLVHLGARGRRVILVTGGSRRSATLVLERLGLGGRFTGIVTGDDVTHGKPHPEIFARAVMSFALDRRGALCVEDGPSGVQSALAAGLDVVWVNGDPSRALPAVPRYARLADWYEVVVDQVR